MAVHLRSAQVDPAAHAKLQRWVHQWPERWVIHTSAHMSWVDSHYTPSEKPLFSISNQAAGGCHVSLKVAEGRESQLPLCRTSSLPAFPSLSPPSPACSAQGPHVYFFMNVWIRWKWGSIGFGFGFHGLTCYYTHTHTHSHTHTHTHTYTHTYTHNLSLSHSHTASQMDWNN